MILLSNGVDVQYCDQLALLFGCFRLCQFFAQHRDGLIDDGIIQPAAQAF
jgi:hypothetical protein